MKLLSLFRKRRSRYIPKAIRTALRKRDKNRCRRCRTREKLEFDHVYPFSKGGEHTVANVRLLCRSCNAKKGDRRGWVTWLKGKDNKWL